MFSLRSLSFSGLGDPFAGLSSYFASCLRCFGIRVCIAQIKKIPNASFGFSVLAAIQRQFCNFGRFSTSCNVAFESIWFHVASNFVFLYVIAVLVVRDFCNSLRLSRQEERLNSLVQAVALSREKEK